MPALSEMAILADAAPPQTGVARRADMGIIPSATMRVHGYHHVVRENAARLTEAAAFRRGYRQGERELDFDWRRELAGMVNREQNPFKRREYQRCLADEMRAEAEAKVRGWEAGAGRAVDAKPGRPRRSTGGVDTRHEFKMVTLSDLGVNSTQSSAAIEATSLARAWLASYTRFPRPETGRTEPRALSTRLARSARPGRREAGDKHPDAAGPGEARTPRHDTEACASSPRPRPPTCMPCLAERARKAYASLIVPQPCLELLPSVTIRTPHSTARSAASCSRAEPSRCARSRAWR